MFRQQHLTVLLSTLHSPCKSNYLNLYIMIVDLTQNWMLNMWVKIERGSHVLEEKKNGMMVEDYIRSGVCFYKM